MKDFSLRLRLLLAVAIACLSVPLHGCVAVNHAGGAPVGLHPEDAPAPDGQKASK